MRNTPMRLIYSVKCSVMKSVIFFFNFLLLITGREKERGGEQKSSTGNPMASQTEISTLRTLYVFVLPAKSLNSSGGCWSGTCTWPSDHPAQCGVLDLSAFCARLKLSGWNDHTNNVHFCKRREAFVVIIPGQEGNRDIWLSYVGDRDPLWYACHYSPSDRFHTWHIADVQ